MRNCIKGFATSGGLRTIELDQGYPEGSRLEIRKVLCKYSCLVDIVQLGTGLGDFGLTPTGRNSKHQMFSGAGLYVLFLGQTHPSLGISHDICQRRVATLRSRRSTWSKKMSGPLLGDREILLLCENLHYLPTLPFISFMSINCPLAQEIG